MKRMSKRFLSMLLAVVMALSMLPVSVFAASVSDVQDAVEGAIDGVVNGTEFNEVTLDGQSVNVGFGAELDPNTVDTVTGNVKLAAGVSMNGKVATGFVEMYLPLDLVAKEVMDGLSKIEGLPTAMAIPNYDEFRYSNNYPTDKVLLSSVKTDLLAPLLQILTGTYGQYMDPDGSITKQVEAGQTKLDNIEKLYQAQSVADIVAVMGWTEEAGYTDAKGNTYNNDGISPEMGDKMLALVGMVEDMADTINGKLGNDATEIIVRVCGNEEVLDEDGNVVWYVKDESVVDVDGNPLKYVTYKGLTVRKEVGFYILGGMDYGVENAVPTFATYVNAPDLVEVTIEVEEQDKGYFIRETYDGEAVEVTAKYDETADAKGAGTLFTKYIGVETDGTLHVVSEAAPTDSGVYVVFSFYFNENTLAMGADAATLIIEPAAVPNGSFGLADNEKVYNGDQYFATLTSSYDAITIARKGTDVYMMIPSNFGDKISAVDDKASAIVEKYLDSKLESALPLPTGLTEKVLGSLTVYSDKAAAALDGTYTVTKDDVVKRLSNYIDAIIEWYDTDKVLAKAGAMADKVKDTLTTSNTIGHYRTIFSAVLDKYDEYKALMGSGSAAASVMLLADDGGDSRGEALVKEFLKQFMTKAGVYEDDVKTLVKDVIDYAKKSEYRQEAITLIETLAAMGGVEDITNEINAVEAAFTKLASDVYKYTEETMPAIPTSNDARIVLGYVEECLGTVMNAAKAVVIRFRDDITIYYGSNPSEVGVYNCYAVNVSANYMPTLVSAQLEITKRPVTITIESKTVELNAKMPDFTYEVTKGSFLEGDTPVVEYTVKDAAGKVVTDCSEEGEYTITATATLENYDITVVDATLIVKEAEEEECTHDWDEGEITTEPTCEDDGVKTFTCKNDSSHTYTETVAALGHTDVVLVDNICDVCGAVLCSETVDHMSGEPMRENEEKPGCQTTGSYDEVVYCTACGVELTRETKLIDAIGSCTPGEPVVENKTFQSCAQGGSYDEVVYCTVCGEEISRVTVYVPADGHTEGEPKVENETKATCTIAGSYDIVIYCTVCGGEVSRTTVTEPAGHTAGTPKKENVIEASCQNDGSYDNVTYCSVCGEELVRDSVKVPSTGEHNYATLVEYVAKTCTTDGYKIWACNCGKTDTETLKTQGHIKVTKVENLRDATCTTSGSYDKVVYCSVCDEELSRDTLKIDPHHNLGEETKENEVKASCTNDGSYDKVAYCLDCGARVAETVHVKATGHDYKGTPVKEDVIEATCQEEGSYNTVLYCTKCNVQLIVNPVTVSRLAHKDTNGDYECDNIVNGKACGHEMCKHVYGTNDCVIKLPAVPATCTTSGLTEGEYCETCYEVKIAQESVPALGHTDEGYKLVNTVPATCTENGYKQYARRCTSCSVLLGSYKIVLRAEGGHVDTDADHVCDKCDAQLCENHPTYTVEKRNVNEASCTVNGSYTKVTLCGDCGQKIAEETVTIPATGHVDEDENGNCDNCGFSLTCGAQHTWTKGATIAPTCGATGYTIWNCTVCSAKKYADTVPATGNHDFGEVPQEYARGEAGHGLVCLECGRRSLWEEHEFIHSADGLTDTCTVCGYKIIRKTETYEFKQDHITEDLIKMGYTTVELVQEAMGQTLEEKGVANVNFANSVLQEVALYRYDPLTGDWEEVGEESFPENGVTVTLNIPDGVVQGEHNLYVTHICKDNGNEFFSEENGLLKVDWEKRTMTFTVKSMSPFMWYWGSATEEEPDEYGTAYNKTVYQVKLIEPWAMKVNVRVTDETYTTIDYSKVKDFGVYAIRRSQLSDPNADVADMTIDALMKEENVHHFTKAEGDVYQNGVYLTFIFEDGLYTYRLKDDIVWVLYYETDEGTYVTAVQERNLFDLMDERKDSTSSTYGDKEKQVYADMVVLYNKVTDYRSDFENQRDMELQNTATIGTTDIGFGAAATDGKYEFARVQQIALIEPWGMRLSTRIYPSEEKDGVVDYSTLDDYGVIVFHDKKNAVADGSMNEYTELLNYKDKSNVYVFSASQSTTEIDGKYAASIYNKDIFTYEMDSTLYYMFFAKDENNFYYSQVYATNIRDLAEARSTSTSSTYTEKEKATYAAMVKLCDSVTAYREWYYSQNDQ